MPAGNIRIYGSRHDVFTLQCKLAMRGLRATGRGRGRGKVALERRECSENRGFIIDTDGKIHLSVRLSVKLK